MNLLGYIAQICVPPPIRKRLLTRLFRDTARVFGRYVPPPLGSADAVLNGFAHFTAQAADASVPPWVSTRLFDVGQTYGKRLRRAFGVTSTANVMAAARVAYAVLGIDFSGDDAGDILIRRCAFSSVYTPRACGVISELDAGLLAGLSDGARLEFSQRITDGHVTCRAHLYQLESLP